MNTKLDEIVDSALEPVDVSEAAREVVLALRKRQSRCICATCMPDVVAIITPILQRHVHNAVAVERAASLLVAEERDKLQTERTALQREVHRLEQRLEGSARHNAALQDVISRRNERIRELEYQSTAKLRDLESMVTAVIDGCGVLGDRQSVHDRVAKALTPFSNDECVSLRKQLRESEQNYAAVAVREHELQVEINQLHASLLDARENAHRWMKQAKASQAEAERLTNAHRDAVDSQYKCKMKVERDSLKSEVERLATVVNLRTEQLDSWMKRATAAQAEVERLTSDHRDAVIVQCKGCRQPLLPENAWVEDGCPCNTPKGVNAGVLEDWRKYVVAQKVEIERLATAHRDAVDGKQVSAPVATADAINERPNAEVDQEEPTANYHPLHTENARLRAENESLRAEVKAAKAAWVALCKSGVAFVKTGDYKDTLDKWAERTDPTWCPPEEAKEAKP